jgi:hypothetical protein
MGIVKPPPVSARKKLKRIQAVVQFPNARRSLRTRRNFFAAFAVKSFKKLAAGLQSIAKVVKKRLRHY